MGAKVITGRRSLGWELCILCCGALILVMFAAQGGAGEPAHIDVGRSKLEDGWFSEVRLELHLDKAVPFRVISLAQPDRVALELKSAAPVGDGQLTQIDQSKRLDLRTGAADEAGWSRLELLLPKPMGVEEAYLKRSDRGDGATISLTLEPVSARSFAENIAKAGETYPQPAQDTDSPKAAPVSYRQKPVIVLDPGHGGGDPGAQRNGVEEADIVLDFALQLADLLTRSGRYEVHLTRSTDRFISLPARVSLARELNADMFISLHADALVSGRATGTAIYTLSEEASDRMSELLVERQQRYDILAGIDLTAQEDDVAKALLDLARGKTAQRSERFAGFLERGLGKALGHLHKQPRLKAGFFVLKSADIPSVLIELGFMSSPEDLSRLLDPRWRAKAAAGVLAALNVWSEKEAFWREKNRDAGRSGEITP